MTDLWFGTSGPRDAKIALVGESWGTEENRQKVPFVGSSGQEFDRMLLEAGIERSSCFSTNVVSAQPKDNELYTLFEPKAKGKPLWLGLHPTPFVREEVTRLWSQLAAIRPQVVIAAGNYALWALTDSGSISSQSLGNGATVLVPSGITSWRGSMLRSRASLGNLAVLPVIHPAGIMRAWYQRAMTIRDLRRHHQALSNDWIENATPTILAPPTFAQAIDYLKSLAGATSPRRVSCDIETARRLITCIGFGEGAYDKSGFAVVIPLIKLLPLRGFDSYWTRSQEVEIIQLLRRVFLNPNILIEGQNFLYDTQYLAEYGLSPEETICSFDTMLAHHLAFPGTPKGLDYLSSLYCRYHRYWKDDNKEWDLNEDETKHLLYNGEDILRTFECATVLRQVLKDMNLEELWEWEKKKADLALRMMFTGVRIDTQRRSQYAFELNVAQSGIISRLDTIIPPSIASGLVKSSKKPWHTSPKQQQILFYDRLGLPPQRNRKTGSLSIDDESLNSLAKKFPELRGLFNLISDLRSIGVFSNNFVSAELEPDHGKGPRMKCSFNPAGTSTFRWSSSENAFRRGTNLQNIPQGDEE